MSICPVWWLQLVNTFLLGLGASCQGAKTGKIAAIERPSLTGSKRELRKAYGTVSIIGRFSGERHRTSRPWGV